MSAPGLAELLERAEALYLDYRLGAVKEWKQRTGGLAIGYMPIYAPRELLHAQGVLPVGLMGGRDDLEIIKGDAYYQSYICHIPRSTIELGLNGSLDALDGMLFPAICDVIRNLSGIWQMQFPDKLSHYLDLPQDFDPEMGGKFYRQDLEHLSELLVQRGARPLTAEALAHSIELYNAERREVQALYELRRLQPWKVPTHELYLVLRAALVLPVEESTAMFRQYHEAVAADQARKPVDQARVVLTGSFCEQPPLGLIKTLERAGCSIVDDDFVQVHRFIRSDIPASDDPLGALVNAFLTDGMASPTRYVDRGRKGDELVQRTKACGAEGLLFCAPSFCDPALLDQPMLVRAVEAEGVPWTAFKYSENSGQFQVIREQAGTFADSIKLWSNA
ncbi:MAG: benzoyl-CoA reductase subunit C [Vicinamibacteria bacterium]|nr:benzoyl-CoA reductase subunit C [Vicinamibacteria bacterium]